MPAAVVALVVWFAAQHTLVAGAMAVESDALAALAAAEPYELCSAASLRALHAALEDAGARTRAPQPTACAPGQPAAARRVRVRGGRCGAGDWVGTQR